MTKDSYDFNDLDAILAEFSDRDAPSSPAPAAPAPKPHAGAAAAERPPAPLRDRTDRDRSVPAPARAEAPSRHGSREKAAALPPLYTREERSRKTPGEKKSPARKTRTLPSLPALRVRAPRKPQPHEPRPRERRPLPEGLQRVLAPVFACLCLLALGWTLFHLHPASGTLSFSGYDNRLRMTDKLDVYVNNAAADALGELAYIKKIYTLQESDTVSPVPDPDGFGTTEDPAVIEELIRKAAILLDGQKVSFDPTADCVPGSVFRYYLDDTILVITWQEYIQERCCTFAEVKIAHGSQLRRKLAEDSYSSSVQLYASDMAKASNAVVAINGDFYAFRDLGITAYQRKLYRNKPAQVDSCFFPASGDMLFSRAGELMGEGETQQFIDDNDVVFAIAFGPVLVDEGELQYCSAYPIGEINVEYSRSCIAMTDELHYLLMTINHTPDARPRATINELARFIYSKGVWKAYTLDGGQTAEIVMMGGPINHVDFGYERIVSDIIYFATAIPEEVRS